MATTNNDFFGQILNTILGISENIEMPMEHVGKAMWLHAIRGYSSCERGFIKY